MERIAIEDSVFRVEGHYGVYQQWLETYGGFSSFRARRSCGLAAASNVILALSTKKGGEALFNKEKTIFHTVKLMEELSKHISPGVFGIISKNPMIRGLKIYGKNRGIHLKESVFRQRFSTQEVEDFIEGSLKKGNPCLFLKYNSSEKDLAYHWVVITQWDRTKKTVGVSNWGEKRCYPLDAFKEFSFHKSLFTMEVQE